MIGALQNYLAPLADGIFVCVEARHEKEIEKRIGKLVKKASKYGCDAPVLVPAGDVFHTVKQRTIVTACPYTGNDKYTTVDVPLTMRGYFVFGGRPKLSGFELLGVLNFSLDSEGRTQATVAEVPGKEIPEEYRTARPACDHCRKARIRHSCVVVRNTETNQVMQVGKSCCKDYLGASMDALLFDLEFRSYFDFTTDRDSSSAGLPRSDYFDTVAMLACVLAVIDVDGAYIPERTRSQATVRYFNMRKHPELHPGAACIDRAIAMLADAREHLASKPTLSTYEHNMHIAVGSSIAPLSVLGVFVSLPSYLAKERGRVAERKVATVVSEFVGRVGDRLTVPCTYLRSNSFETSFGTMHIHLFRDTSGNVLVWKTSSGIRVDNGSTITLTATVKEHSTYRDIKQTVLARAKIAA